MIVIDDLIVKVEDHNINGLISLKPEERELIVEALIYYKEIYI